MPRLDQLLELLRQDPADSFARYAVAMEYAKLARPDDALAEFRELLRRNPDYVAAYFMAGRTCEQKSDLDSAKDFYRHGIATAQKIGDTHAAGEIADALAAIA